MDQLGLFIDKLLGKATASGIAKAEAYLSRSDSYSSEAEGCVLSKYEVNSSGGLALRGLVNGKMGIAYTEAFDDDAAAMLIERVIENASLIEDTDEQFLFEGSPAYEKINTLAKTPGGGSEADKNALTLNLEKTTLSLDPLVKKIEQVGVSSSHSEIRIVGTSGMNLRHESDNLYAFVGAVAQRGDNVQAASALRIGRDLSDIDAADIAREAVETAVFLLDAKPCESGAYEVIMRNDAMASLLGTFDGIFSAENTQKSLSLLAGKVGETIASGRVTIVDDPHLKTGLATRSFDDEGVATYRKNVIDHGKLTTLLHNLKTAKKDGIASTGNGSKASYASAVKVSPSNFYIEPGEDSLDTLCGKMGDGLVIIELAGLHAGADAISGDFSVQAKGYRVRGGKKAEAVSQITVAGNFYTLLKQVEAVGGDLVFPWGSTGSPSVWVGKLSAAGV